MCDEEIHRDGRNASGIEMCGSHHTPWTLTVLLHSGTRNFVERVVLSRLLSLCTCHGLSIANERRNHISVVYAQSGG